MEGPSPARLYATLVGAALTIFGIVGFFYSASFGSPGEVEDVLGAFATNGWLNLLYALTGAASLLAAGFAARRVAFLLGLLYFALALWGFAIGSDDAILGLLPANAGDDLLHLALGALGLAAAWATPRPADGGAKPAAGGPTVAGAG